MEMIDICDIQGNITGEVKSRKEVHEKGYLHKTIHVWVVDNNDRILIQKRSKHKSTHPLMWDVSCAGHVSSGETSRQAAVKELEEEVGLRVEEKDLQFITTIEKKYFKDKIRDHEIYDVFLIKMDLDINKISFDLKEVEKVDLMSFDDFFENADTREDFINNPKEYQLMKKILMGKG